MNLHTSVTSVFLGCVGLNVGSCLFQREVTLKAANSSELKLIELGGFPGTQFLSRG